MNPQEMNHHLGELLKLAQERFAELDIDASFLDRGRLRLLNEVIMEYWSDLEEREDGFLVPDEITVVSSEITEGPVRGIAIQAVDKEGHCTSIALVDPNEDAMYVAGHRITILSDGKVHSVHQDGSPCEVGCRFCQNPDIHVREEDNEAYAYCANCNTATDTYPRKFEAFGAWVIGKVETSEPDSGERIEF